MVKALIIIFVALAASGAVLAVLAATSQQAAPLLWAAGCWMLAALAMLIASSLDGEHLWD